VRVSDGAKLYDLNPKETLVPASVTKLLTAAAVLAKFTPAHVFKTQFYYDGQWNGGVVTGNLYVVGDGDPYLVSEKLWQLAVDLRHLGLKEVKGSLIIDDSLFGDPAWDRSRSGGKMQSNHAYDSPVSAFGVNFNTFAVAIAPNKGTQNKPLVNLDPYPLPHVAIDNLAKPSKGANSRGLTVTRIKDSSGRDRLKVNGEIGDHSSLQKVYRSVSQHIKSSGEIVKAFLGQEGIVVRGAPKSGVLPAKATLLYELESLPMSQIVRGLNVFSNNYIADVLVKRLGAAFPPSGQANGRHQGTYENGIRAVSRFLTNDVGIASDFILEDGSGLNVANRLNSQQLTDVLVYMAKRMEFFPEFLGSLPAAAWDGTMKNRFQNRQGSELEGQVRAKTGTLTSPVSVSSLAGYFIHPKQGLVAFSIIHNGRRNHAQPPIAELRQMQDRGLAQLYQVL
jgi:D-alanyl-D-alanine carboxypeptidase/D-alanyl-D-alanine-endopeptidase (penicillin-binding protein 4)